MRFVGALLFPFLLDLRETAILVTNEAIAGLTLISPERMLQFVSDFMQEASTN